jgi:cobyrinic acid a,c-diamide synthase
VTTIHPSAKAFLVAGTRSGCGKTSVSLGLMAAMAESGIRVQPYKAGPDFIDPGHHEAVTGRPSHNLDGWMLDPETVRNIFARHLHGSDVGIVEGAMGLFDGFSGTTEQGSAGQLAKILDIPVILVVDARGMGRSAAAEVKGYVTFDPDITFAGVIFNQVASPRHETLLKEAMAKNLPEIPVLGCLPRNDALNVPSRHLGLVMGHEVATRERTQDLIQWIASAMDVRELIKKLPNIFLSPTRETSERHPRKIRVGVAMDRAFCFYYRENLRLLEQAGAELVFFSPLEDKQLPTALHGLYLGGGYPELYASQLAANTSMRGSVKTFARAGHPVYAECGGFMYLMNHLEDTGGRHEMVGIFDCDCAMCKRFAALGYREVVTTAPSILGPAGSRFRGHEFHYSRLIDSDLTGEGLYQTTDRKGEYPAGKGVVTYNTLGSYIHLHFASNPELAPAFVRACAKESPL